LKKEWLKAQGTRWPRQEEQENQEEQEEQEEEKEEDKWHRMNKSWRCQMLWIW